MKEKEKVNVLSCERDKLLPFSGLALLLSNLLTACDGTSDPAVQQSSDEPISSTQYLNAAKNYPGNDALREAWSGESWDGQINNLAVILPGRVVVDSRDYQDLNLFPSTAFYDADNNLYIHGFAAEPLDNPSDVGSEFYPVRLLKLDTNFEPVSNFGDNGIISARFPTEDFFTDGYNQDSNYIYAVGYDDNSATIARIDKKTGKVDTEFSDKGILELSLDAFPAEIKPDKTYFLDVTALEDNKLLISYWLDSGKGGQYTVIQKIEQNGSVNTFGEDGFLLFRNNHEQNVFFDYYGNQNNLIYDPNHKTFLLVGYDYNSSDIESLYINRYDINGKLDTTFANQGYYEIHQSEVPAEVTFGGGGDSFYYDDEEGALYITNSTCCRNNENQNYAIIKLSYNKNKTQLSLDKAFGDQGILVSSVSSDTFYVDTEKVDDQLFLFGGSFTFLDEGVTTTTTDYTIEQMTFNSDGNELEINSVKTAFPVTNFMSDTVFNAVANDQYFLFSSLSSYDDGSGLLLSLTDAQLQNQHLAVMLENTQGTILVGMADNLDSKYWFDNDPDFYQLSDNLTPDGAITFALSCNAPGIGFSYTGDEEIDFTSQQNHGKANASFELTHENYNQFHSIVMNADEVNEDTYVEVTVSSTYTDTVDDEMSEERTFLVTILDSDNDAILG